jgi:hypothetical protein
MFDWLGKYWRDVLDVASTAATVAAAGLAWWAIRRGNRQARASADALVRERRIDFELGHLDKMGEAVERLGNPGGSETFTRALTLLPADEFPRLRARVGMSSTPKAVAAFVETQKLGQEQAVDVYHQGMRDEINQAIKRRLAERG